MIAVKKQWSALATILVLLMCLVFAVLPAVDAWTPNPFSNFLFSSPSQRVLLRFDDTEDRPTKSSEEGAAASNVHETRRRFLSAAAMNICFLGASAPAIAAAETSTRYISGKPPQVPGQKPQDKSNLKGTKKDPDFLRSIADCRNQCQNSASGPDGLAKSKEDCLSECQDICCKTYEQCTFNIVPRI